MRDSSLSLSLSLSVLIQIIIPISSSLLQIFQQHTASKHPDDILVVEIINLELTTLFRADQARANIAIRGTKGYVAPEWFQNMGITAKVDAHNFGVTLLKVVCCRKLVEPQLENAEAIILTNWVDACYMLSPKSILQLGRERLLDRASFRADLQRSLRTRGVGDGPLQKTLRRSSQ